MGCQRKEIAFDLVRYLDLFQRLLCRPQQARVVDGDCGMRGSDGQDRHVTLSETAFAFVDRLQHAHGPILDRHGHAKQGIDFEFDVIGNQGIMTRVLFDVVQDQRLVGAEDRPGETAINRDGNLSQLGGIRPGGGGKVQPRIFSS